MNLKITEKKVRRTDFIEIIDQSAERGYVSIHIRARTRLVHAFAFTNQRSRPDVAVVSVYDRDSAGNECEFRYWVGSTVKTVRGLKRIALATLRHHDQAKAEAGG